MPLEQADARQPLGRRARLAAGQAGAQRARLGQVRRSWLARDVGDQIGERARAIAGRRARERPREARLLHVERDRAIDPGRHRRIGGRALGERADPRRQRPQRRAVVPERGDRLGRHVPGQRVGAHRRLDVAGRFGQRLLDEIAPEPARIADLDPLLGLVIERARVLAGCGRVRRGGRRRQRRAAARELRAQRAQVGPRRLEHQRVLQRLVGAIGLERAAVDRQQAAERAPAAGVRRRQVHRDLQIAHRLVDAPERLQRAGAQEARARPARRLLHQQVEARAGLVGCGRRRARARRRSASACCAAVGAGVGQSSSACARSSSAIASSRSSTRLRCARVSGGAPSAAPAPAAVRAARAPRRCARRRARSSRGAAAAAAAPWRRPSARRAPSRSRRSPDRAAPSATDRRPADRRG